jgi:hypothetical protein
MFKERKKCPLHSLLVSWLSLTSTYSTSFPILLIRRCEDGYHHFMSGDGESLPSFTEEDKKGALLVIPDMKDEKAFSITDHSDGTKFVLNNDLRIEYELNKEIHPQFKAKCRNHGLLKIVEQIIVDYFQLSENREESALCVEFEALVEKAENTIYK